MTEASVESARKFIKDFGNDGWSILEPEGLIKTYGFPREWVMRLVFNHQSGNDHKSSIYDDRTGKRLKSLKGVHTLSVLQRLAGQFDAKTPSYFGRGRQAGAYSEAIIKVIGLK